MGNAARKARKRSGEKFTKPAKVPTGKMPKASAVPTLMNEDVLRAAVALGKQMWETRW